MRRQLTVLVLTGIIGSFVLSSDASACHNRKRCAAPAACVVAAPAPCVVAAPAPCAAPAPVACAPRKNCFSGFKMPKFKGFGCHKRQVACETQAIYAAPQAVYAAPQAIYAAPQASGQGS